MSLFVILQTVVQNYAFGMRSISPVQLQFKRMDKCNIITRLDDKIAARIRIFAYKSGLHYIFRNYENISQFLCEFYRTDI